MWWRHHHRTSQMILQSADLLRIRSCACVKKIQRIKASALVVAPLWFGHRNLAGGVSERRCMQVSGAGVLLDERKMMENTGMIRSSPRCRGASQRGRRRSGEGDRRRPVIGMPSLPASTGSFPARLAWRGEGEHHGGASEHLMGARGVLKRQRRNMAGARVSVVTRKASGKGKQEI
jgi:hypothetical protein